MATTRHAASGPCITCGRDVSEGAQAESCSKCDSAIYCSYRCRKEDFPIHNLICGQYDAIINDRPDGLHILAIYLSDTIPQPRFKWLKTDELNRIEEEATIKDRYHVSKSLATINKGSSRFTTEHSVLMYRGHTEEMKKNACINLFMNYRALDHWKGQFIVIAYVNHFEEDYQNITLSDLRLAVDFVRTYNPHGWNEPYDRDFVLRELYVNQTRDDVLNRGQSEEMIQGVVMSCLGDILMLDHAKYIAVKVRADHPAFEVNQIKIAGAMDLGIVSFALPAHESWRKHNKASLGFNPYENTEVVHMHLDINASNRIWGFSSPREWTVKIGSVLLVRKNREHMTIHQAEAFARFCCDVISRAVWDQIVIEKPERIELDDEFGKYEPSTDMSIERRKNRMKQRYDRLEIFQEVICRDNFEEFFDQYKWEKVEAGETDWGNAKSLYRRQDKEDEDVSS